MARAALDWNIHSLSEYSGVHRNTIMKFEKGGEVRESIITALKLTFENAGVIFIAENGEGPGVRLRKS
ncbi:MAG: transcriptional regulator [Pseudomonadota bacterium]|nr:transcriptional regulator [Pseudomonadota bacterium]